VAAGIAHQHDELQRTVFGYGANFFTNLQRVSITSQKLDNVALPLAAGKPRLHGRAKLSGANDDDVRFLCRRCIAHGKQ